MRSSSAVIFCLLVVSALASGSTKTKTKTTTTKKASTAAPATTQAPATKPTQAAPATKKPAPATKVSSTTTTAKTMKMVKKVRVKFTFAALVLSKLKPAVKTAMTKAVTDSVLEGLGAGYTKDHIAVELKAGSIIAVVSITPKAGATAAALSTSMNTTARGAIEKSMATKVKVVPNISQALASGKTLADVAAVSAAPTVVEVAVPITAAPTTAARTTAKPSNFTEEKPCWYPQVINPAGGCMNPPTPKATAATSASAPIAEVSMMSMMMVVLAASQVFA